MLETRTSAYAIEGRRCLERFFCAGRSAVLHLAAAPVAFSGRSGPAPSRWAFGHCTMPGGHQSVPTGSIAFRTGMAARGLRVLPDRFSRFDEPITACGVPIRSNRNPGAIYRGRLFGTIYRIGENADGITSAFSCFSTTPGGFRAGHCPPAAAAARTLKRSFASL